MRTFVVFCLASLPLAALAADPFKLESAEIKPNSTIAEAQVFKGFGCAGGNLSPSDYCSKAREAAERCDTNVSAHGRGEDEPGLLAILGDN